MTLASLRNSLRAWLQTSSKTQKELAGELGVSPSQVSRFLAAKGEKGLSAENRKKAEEFVKNLKPEEIDRPVLTDQQAAILAEKLYNDKLALFVGAGISHLAPARDGSDRRLPLWGELGKQVASVCNFRDAEFYDNPLELFDAMAHDPSIGRGALEDAVAERLDSSGFSLAEAHERIERLPFHVIYTTNYDTLLDRLMPNLPPIVTEEEHHEPVRKLIKLHGSLAYKGPSGDKGCNLHTLTQDDYRSWRVRHPNAFGVLQRTLQTRSVLFIGYSLNDPHFDELLRQIRQVGTQSFAWLWKPPVSRIRLYETRDGLDIASIQSEGDWVRALAQVEEALVTYKAAKEGASGPIQLGIQFTPQEDLKQWKRYSVAMNALYGKANLEGLYVGRSYMSDHISVDEIFVEPDFEDWRSGSSPDLEGLKITDGAKELLDEKGRRLQIPDPKIGVSRRTPALKAMEGERLLAILGQPGQGKSTLMQKYLLRQCAEVERRLAARDTRDQFSLPRPIYLRLSLWETYGDAEDTRESFFRFARERIMADADISEQAAEEWLSGPVVWLLDGIDEIRSAGRREQLRSLLVRCSQQNEACCNHRWIVSSRPSGYYKQGLGANWDQRKLADLSEDQSLNLLESWMKILQRIDGINEKPEKIHTDLKNSASLSRILGNPLLLTLVVLFFKARRTLPRDRWEYYEHATRVLAETWLIHRSKGGGREPHSFPYLKDLLSSLALDMMRQGVVAISARHLRTALEDYLKRRGYSGRVLDSEIQEFMAAAEDLIGVLVSKGGDRFGFLHLSFQEYYAANKLRSDQVEARRMLEANWDHPDWSELWDLYFLSLEDGRRLEVDLETLCSIENEIFRKMNSPLLRAVRWGNLANCLVEDDAVVNKLACNLIVDSLWIELLGQVFTGGVSLKASSPVLTRLQELLSDSALDESIRASAASVLEKSIGSREGIEELFLDLLERKTGGLMLRRMLASGLGSVAHRSRSARGKLVGMLKDQSEDSGVRQVCVVALRNVAEEDQDVRNSLVTIFESADEDYRLRFQIAAVVRRFSGIDERIENVMMKVWRSEGDYEPVQYMAVTSLSKKGDVSIACREELLTVAQEFARTGTNSEIPHLKMAGTFYGLAAQMEGDPDVLGFFKRVLVDPEVSLEVKGLGAQVLSHEVKEDLELAKYLYEFVVDREECLALRAGVLMWMENWVELLDRNALEELIALCNDGAEDFSLRVESAFILKSIGEPTGIDDVLIEAVRSDQFDDYERMRLISLLIDGDECSEGVLGLILEVFLNSKAGITLRLRALSGIEIYAAEDGSAFEAIWLVLWDETEAMQVRKAAWKSVAKIVASRRHSGKRLDCFQVMNGL